VSVKQIKSFDVHRAEKEEAGKNVQTCVDCHNPHTTVSE
jgi:Zn-finger protein